MAPSDLAHKRLVIRIQLTWNRWLCLQTTQYSTQIFSLAVLLSSLFVYNQMGGIDEAALDRLSLVTEMTKHIRVRAGSGAVGERPASGPCA